MNIGNYDRIGGREEQEGPEDPQEYETAEWTARLEWVEREKDLIPGHLVSVNGKPAWH